MRTHFAAVSAAMLYSISGHVLLTTRFTFVNMFACLRKSAERSVFRTVPTNAEVFFRGL